jgi:hypothetical protein
VAGWWFSLGSSASSTNKTDRHDITEIFLKVALSTIIPTNQTNKNDNCYKTEILLKLNTNNIAALEV